MSIPVQTAKAIVKRVRLQIDLRQAMQEAKSRDEQVQTASTVIEAQRRIDAHEQASRDHGLFDRFLHSLTYERAWQVVYAEARATLTPNGENRHALHKAWLDALTDEDAAIETFRGALDRDRFLVASILAPKPDPLGRYPLCDMRSLQSQAHGKGAHLLTLAGYEHAPLLFESHPNRDQRAPCGDKWLRMHSMTPGGARIPGRGFGVAGYVGTALAAYIVRGHNGLFSSDEGGRTNMGGELWESMKRQGLAVNAPDDCDTGTVENDEYDENHEVTVKLTERQRQSLSDNYASNRGDSGWSDDELTGNMTFHYTGSRSMKPGDEDYYMPVSIASGCPLVAFMPSDESDYFCAGIDPAWSIASLTKNVWSKAQTTERKRTRHLADDFSDDNFRPQIEHGTTAEMLVNAAHGPSIGLILTIAEALVRGKHEDLAVTYLSRPDIARVAGRHPRVLELLGQRRLPGLDGLSRAAGRELLGTLRAAETGKLVIDWSTANPLRLHKLSVDTKRELKPWAAVED